MAIPGRAGERFCPRNAWALRGAVKLAQMRKLVCMRAFAHPADLVYRKRVFTGLAQEEFPWRKSVITVGGSLEGLSVSPGGQASRPPAWAHRRNRRRVRYGGRSDT